MSAVLAAAGPPAVAHSPVAHLPVAHLIAPLAAGQLVAARWTAAQPPTAPQPPDDIVGPGVGGFIAIFILALATVLLIRSMVGHLRKVRYGPGPPDDDAPVMPPAGPDHARPRGQGRAPDGPGSAAGPEEPG